jgi:hypothetical protein
VLCALPSGAQWHQYPAGAHAGAASVRAVAIVGGMWAAWRVGAGLVRTLGETTVMAARGVAHWQLLVDPVLAWLVQHIGAAGHPGRPRRWTKWVGHHIKRRGAAGAAHRRCTTRPSSPLPLGRSRASCAPAQPARAWRARA